MDVNWWRMERMLQRIIYNLFFVLGMWRAPQRGRHEFKILHVWIGSLSSERFERRTSTGSEPFSLLISLDATVFVLLSVTHVNRKWAFFSFNKPWRYRICIAKCLNSYRDNSPKHLFKITDQECKKSTFGWRASKLPIFCRASFLPTRLTAPGSPRMCTTMTWKYLVSRPGFVEDVNTTQRLLLFSWTSVQSFRIQL